MTITSEGKFQYRKISFQNNTLTLWGHHLKEADLLYYFRAGDEFSVEINDSNENNLMVRRTIL